MTDLQYIFVDAKSILYLRNHCLRLCLQVEIMTTSRIAVNFLVSLYTNMFI
jgi:hypothetical protein